MTEGAFGDVIVKPSPIHGFGVFAARDFRAGEVIFDTSELRLVTAEDPLREGEEERHCDWLADGRQILLPEPARYINHCCNPSAWKEYRNVVRRCARQKFALRVVKADPHHSAPIAMNAKRRSFSRSARLRKKMRAVRIMERTPRKSRSA